MCVEQIVRQMLVCTVLSAGCRRTQCTLWCSRRTAGTLVSSGADSALLNWDMANGHLITSLAQHTDTVYCLQFSRH